jgi:hypothetical protein
MSLSFDHIDIGGIYHLNKNDFVFNVPYGTDATNDSEILWNEPFLVLNKYDISGPRNMPEIKILFKNSIWYLTVYKDLKLIRIC